MFEKIYRYLKSKGFDVYSIGQHTGLCTNPYIVIKDQGQNPYAGLSLNYDMVDIIIYYPMPSYSKVSSYVKEVEAALKDLKELTNTNQRLPIVIDDDKKAYTTSIMYQIFKSRR